MNGRLLRLLRKLDAMPRPRQLVVAKPVDRDNAHDRYDCSDGTQRSGDELRMLDGVTVLRITYA